MTQSPPAWDGLPDLLRRRIVVAPMAGGPTTADLVIAAGRAGALGFLAAGYKTPEAMAAEITAVTSFTFGCPPRGVIRALQDAGSAVAVTVTSPAEAGLAAEAGADALCVQGYEAGAHRGTFGNDDAPGRDRDLLSLIGEVAAVTGLQQVAAGGIMGPRQVRAVLAAGAAAAQCGTAFLRSPESGAHPLHKAALADPRYTATTVTRAFSGRPARGLVNEFIIEHADAPPAYPEINNATRPLRAAAAARGDTERMSLWAGQGYRLAAELPAADIVDRLRG
jgi:nitronate monooxygenase